MKKQIRQGVFETNSSSVHSLTICSKDEFDAWVRGEVLLDDYSAKFVPIKLSDDIKVEAEKEYEELKDILFSKDWKDLSDDAKEKYYERYALKHRLINEDAETYEQYMDSYLETFKQTYTSKSGDEIVAFGKYGYDG